MSDIPRSPRFAMIPPIPAVWIDRELGPFFRKKARELMAMGDAPGARQYSFAADQARDAARDWFESRLEAASASGSGELPQSSVRAELESPWWSTGVVAEKLKLKSARQVRNLAHQGRLSAVTHGGRMLIDPASVAEELQRRQGDDG